MQSLENNEVGESQANKKGRMNKFFSLTVTFAIIGLLVFLGPVNALQLSLSGLRSGSYTAGETIKFNGQIDIADQDIPEIKNVSLYINNQNVCTIDIWGWILYGCEGVNITLLEYDTAYGYGYGYDQFVEQGNGSYPGYGYSYGYHQGKNKPGKISYNISVETPNEKLWYGGDNKLKFVVDTGQQMLESDEYNVMLNPIIAGTGNFLLGTTDAEFLLWGKYNQTDHTLVGKFTNIATPENEFLYYAVGNYDPQTPTSGNMKFRLYNANLENDIGIFWYGNYSAGTWRLSPDPTTLGTTYIEGSMFVAPQ